jgi:uronate dehydrogenase
MADSCGRPSVLITGAAGRLGGILIRSLRSSCSLSLLDCRPLAAPSGMPFFRINLAEPRDLAPCLDSMDAVVHLAGIPTNRASWEALIESNVLAVQNLLRESARHRCPRVILASSVQVMDGYPPGTDITPDLAVRPVNSYGASKACAEAVAQRFGRKGAMTILCLRLGWVLPRFDWRITPWSRHLERILTEADFLRVLRAAIRCDRGPVFEIHHALSDNRRKRLNIDSARAVLGYEPRDDSYAIARTNFPGMARSAAILFRGRWKAWSGAHASG